MAAVSDSIEAFIISLLEDEGVVELRRNELAQYFGCAPSQINYVLSTRFTVERGYLIRSKRGGGGYIAIERIPISAAELHALLTDQIDDRMSRAQAAALIDNLMESRIVSLREGAIMFAAVDKFPMTARETQDYLRAQVMRAMMTALLRDVSGEIPK